MRVDNSPVNISLVNMLKRNKVNTCIKSNAMFIVMDDCAFDRIYKNNFNKLYGYAYSLLKDTYLSQDIVQETFMNIWENRWKLNLGLSIEPLLFTVSKRLVLDTFKKQSSSKKYMAYVAIANDYFADDLEKKIVSRDLINHVKIAHTSLPTHQQAVYRMKQFEQLSNQEIAKVMNTSISTVKNQLVMASKNVRLKIEN